MSLLVAIDPGETSGIVALREDGSVVAVGAVEAGATLGMLREMLRTSTVEYVVYEQFRMYGNRVGASKSFSDLPEVKIIGAIEVVCESYGIKSASVPAGIYKTSTEQWKPPTGISGTHRRDAWRLATWFHIVRLKRPATLTLKDGRVILMNIEVTKEEATHKEIT